MVSNRFPKNVKTLWFYSCCPWKGLETLWGENRFPKINRKLRLFFHNPATLLWNSQTQSQTSHGHIRLLHTCVAKLPALFLLYRLGLKAASNDQWSQSTNSQTQIWIESNLYFNLRLGPSSPKQPRGQFAAWSPQVSMLLMEKREARTWGKEKKLSRLCKSFNHEAPKRWTSCEIESVQPKLDHLISLISGKNYEKHRKTQFL